jgi:sRNA-binding protein
MPTPRCIALVHSAANASLWERCPHNALRGDRFCADHRHALDGAVLGFLDTKEYRHAQAKYQAKARRRALRNQKKADHARTRAQTRERSLAAKKSERLRRFKFPKLRDPQAALAQFFGEESAP